MYNIFYSFPIAIIDLSDLQGAVKNLTDHQTANASEFLNERETFILVRVESKKVVALLFDVKRITIQSYSKGK